MDVTKNQALLGVNCMYVGCRLNYKNDIRLLSDEEWFGESKGKYWRSNWLSKNIFEEKEKFKQLQRLRKKWKTAIKKYRQFEKARTVYKICPRIWKLLQSFDSQRYYRLDYKTKKERPKLKKKKKKKNNVENLIKRKQSKYMMEPETQISEFETLILDTLTKN
ncbi:MAG: hypothetical protein Ta2E_12320 [Mycoplasmoidaceae bacterium]|nr:MAG: hypothetical protein Ta2E_12320 [Mycoplasmoidaceae bacterium]